MFGSRWQFHSLSGVGVGVVAPWSLDDSAQFGIVVKSSGPSLDRAFISTSPTACTILPYYSWKSLSEKTHNSFTLGELLAALGYISAHPCKGLIFKLETTAHPELGHDKQEGELGWRLQGAVAPWWGGTTVLVGTTTTDVGEMTPRFCVVLGPAAICMCNV